MFSFELCRAPFDLFVSQHYASNVDLFIIERGAIFLRFPQRKQIIDRVAGYIFVLSDRRAGWMSLAQNDVVIAL